MKKMIKASEYSEKQEILNSMGELSNQCYKFSITLNQLADTNEEAAISGDMKYKVQELQKLIDNFWSAINI